MLRHKRVLAGTLAFTLVLSITALAVDLPPGGTFTDDNGSVHEPNIEAIAQEEITRGCNPPQNDLFCPGDSVTRGQMAAFIVRALDLELFGDALIFDDIQDSVFRDDINALAAAGVTKGCDPPDNVNYCPQDVVSRGQMAAFLVRALDLAAADPDLFGDDDGSVFESDINALAAAGITKGCNPPANDSYCPAQPVTRGEMATFLTRALGLTPITPPPPTTSTTTSTSTTSTSTTSSTTTTTTIHTTTTTQPSSGWDPDTCTFDGIPMWGKVQVVDFLADVTIQEVDFLPDLRVQVVDSLPNSCGKWQQVDFLPDFTVQFVDFLPDLTIQYVDFLPGT